MANILILIKKKMKKENSLLGRFIHIMLYYLQSPRYFLLQDDSLEDIQYNHLFRIPYIPTYIRDITHQFHKN